MRDRTVIALVALCTTLGAAAWLTIVFIDRARKEFDADR